MTLQEPTSITWRLPLRTVSEGNCFEGWRRKHERHKHQRYAIRAAFNAHPVKINLPCQITLTRIAPRKLDKEDNLPMSFKWVKDAVADNIIQGKAWGRADDSPQIEWRYAQEKGIPREYAIKITFLFQA